MRYREVEIGRQAELDNGEHDGKRLLVVDALDENVEAQDELDRERNVIDDHRGGIANRKHMGFRRQELHRAEDATASNDKRTYNGDIATRTVVAHEHQDKSDEHGKQDKKRRRRYSDIHQDTPPPDVDGRAESDRANLTTLVQWRVFWLRKTVSASNALP